MKKKQLVKITCLIYLHSTKESSRKSPIKTGYRPTVCFVRDYKDSWFYGKLIGEMDYWLELGEQHRVSILLSKNNLSFINDLYDADIYLVEGERRIATVMSIFDIDLEYEE